MTTGTGDQLESDPVMPGSTEHAVAAQSVAAKQASPAADDASAATEATAAVPQHGFELRSALYACIDGQEKARDALLQNCANDMKKRYRAVPRSTISAQQLVRRLNHPRSPSEPGQRFLQGRPTGEQCSPANPASLAKKPREAMQNIPIH